MITLPVWAVVCLCSPSAVLAVLYIMTGIVSLWDHREAYKDELRAEFRAEFESEQPPIERLFRSGEEAIERKNTDVYCWDDEEK